MADKPTIFKLSDIGLSIDMLTELSQKLGVVAHRHGITPDKIRDRLLQELENLDKGLGLETLARKRQLELEETERSIAAGAQDLEAKQASVETLRKEKARLEASIQEMSNRVTQEIAKMTPAAMEAVRQLVEKINLRQNEALAEVNHLKDEALEVGREVGRYEEVVRDNRWITQLSAIVRGEDGVEGRDVKTITLSVVHGVTVWLQQQSGEYLAVSSLKLAAENLLRELERWKV